MTVTGEKKKRTTFRLRGDELESLTLVAEFYCLIAMGRAARLSRLETNNTETVRSR